MLLLLMLFTAAACRKDKGNYEYQEVNVVSFGGIKASYSALLGDKFKLQPELKFSKDNGADENQYTYEWWVTGSTLPGEQKKVLSTERNLEMVLQLAPGTYRVYYQVTVKDTGVTYRTSFTLKVETSIFEGWMALSDVNGQARLDMISKIDDKYTLIADVLAFSGSELSLKGKPLNVSCYSYQSGIYGIYISTDQSTNRIAPNDFTWKNTYNLSYEMVAKVPADFHADFLAPIKEDGGTSYFYAAGNVYFYYDLYQINYSLPINLVKGETLPFKTAPFLAVALNKGTFEANATLFDTDKKRFLRHSANESNVTTFAAGKLFDFNNVGMDLAYMQYSPYNGGEVFAVLKNPAGKIYLARFNAFSGVQTYFSELTGAEGLANADKYAVSPVYGYLFYAVGGKVYEYDTSLKSAKVMINKGAEKITVLKFHEFGITGSSRPQYQIRKNQLLICSYDPALAADKNGKLELYNVPSLNADLTLVESYSGLGKVISVDYRER